MYVLNAVGNRAHSFLERNLHDNSRDNHTSVVSSFFKYLEHNVIHFSGDMPNVACGSQIWGAT